MKVKDEGQNASSVHMFAWGSMYSMFHQPESQETEGNSVRKKLPCKKHPFRCEVCINYSLKYRRYVCILICWYICISIQQYLYLYAYIKLCISYIYIYMYVSIGFSMCHLKVQKICSVFGLIDGIPHSALQVTKYHSNFWC